MHSPCIWTRTLSDWHAGPGRGPQQSMCVDSICRENCTDGAYDRDRSVGVLPAVSSVWAASFSARSAEHCALSPAPQPRCKYVGVGVGVGRLLSRRANGLEVGTLRHRRIGIFVSQLLTVLPVCLLGADGERQDIAI